MIKAFGESGEDANPSLPVWASGPVIGRDFEPALLWLCRLRSDPDPAKAGSNPFLPIGSTEVFERSLPKGDFGMPHPGGVT